MRVFVLDPGFIAPVGHHRAVNDLIARECTRRNVPTVVLGGTEFPEDADLDFQCVPCFSESLYHVDRVHPLAAPMIMARRNLDVFREVGSLMTDDRLLPGDVFIVHTASWDQLVGLHLWFKELKTPGLKMRIILRFPAHFFTSDHVEMVTECFRTGLRVWASSDADVRFFTDNHGLREWYEGLVDLKFPVLPISIDFADYPQPGPVRPLDGRGLHFVSAGDARHEKGSPLMPQAFARHLQRYPNDRFTVQTPLCPEPVVDVLKRLHPAVTLIDRPLWGEDFHRLIQSADCVLVPYSPQAYHLRTSHIFVESVGLGRPVVGSARSWIEEEMQAIGFPVGTLIDGWNPHSLEAALTAFREDHVRYMDNALFAAPFMRRKHNAGRFMDLLLDGVDT